MKDFVYICDRAYTKQDILAMEGRILESVGFELTYISPLTFLERYIFLEHKEEDLQIYQTKEFFLARYLLELCLHDYYSLQ